jgi:hypothetical protein
MKSLRLSICLCKIYLIDLLIKSIIVEITKQTTQKTYMAASFINCLNFVCSLSLNIHRKFFLKFCCLGNRLWKSCSILMFLLFLLWIFQMSKMLGFLFYKNGIWFSKKFIFRKVEKLRISMKNLWNSIVS